MGKIRRPALPNKSVEGQVFFSYPDSLSIENDMLC
jgi:hypothetical protein